MIAGITRIRNESEIIQETLDYYARWCGRIYVFDDASEDETAEICATHPAVAEVIRAQTFDPDRWSAEYRQRNAVLKRAQEDRPDWILCFDADERIEFDGELPEDCDAIRMSLFDFYITPEDATEKYSNRQWLGPEYREIIFITRNEASLRFDENHHRELIPSSGKIRLKGRVRHYGKARSVEDWERKCQLYQGYNYLDSYKRKWRQRMGKAIHKDYLSDFGRPLIRWEEIEEKGVLLVDPFYVQGSPSREHGVLRCAWLRLKKQAFR